MKSWLKGNVCVFRQGYKDGREVARKIHRLGAKNRPRSRMIRKAEKIRRANNDKRNAHKKSYGNNDVVSRKYRIEIGNNIV